MWYLVEVVVHAGRGHLVPDLGAAGVDGPRRPELRLVLDVVLLPQKVLPAAQLPPASSRRQGRLPLNPRVLLRNIFSYIWSTTTATASLPS